MYRKTEMESLARKIESVYPENKEKDKRWNKYSDIPFLKELFNWRNNG